MKLCPFSFGLALGVTSALAVIVWVLWVMYAGPTDMMVQYHIPMPTLMEGLMKALKVLIKGFVFGAVFAFVYDFIACCCKSMCWRK